MQTMYNLGRVLRERYDDHLGHYYLPNQLDARCSEFKRTQTSLQLVLSGLFPPKFEQLWNDRLNWQPIPYMFYPDAQDEVTLRKTTKFSCDAISSPNFSYSPVYFTRRAS